MFDLDLNHNAISTKDRSSLFDGKIVSKPDEKVGKQILEWLNHGGSAGPGAAPNTSHLSPTTSPLPVRSSLHSSAPLTRHLVPPAKENAPATPPLFDGSGALAGEKETAAMLQAVAEATTNERLFSIDKSRRLGFDTSRLTLDQARKIREAIDVRRAELSRVAGPKAA